MLQVLFCRLPSKDNEITFNVGGSPTYYKHQNNKIMVKLIIEVSEEYIRTNSEIECVEKKARDNEKRGGYKGSL